MDIREISGVGLQDSLRKVMIMPMTVEFIEMFHNLRWMIGLAMVLIIADFWFGINESKYLHKPIRRSRACRRTFNKFIDYILYISMGALLGKAFGTPFGWDPMVISAIVMILCYGFEIDSIYGHICVIHGIKTHISIWKILFMIITLRFKSLQNILNDMANQVTEQTKNNKNNE
jgi:hypothetical protein|nr:MAG TPA: holin [Caudoviricetes sp.]